MNIFLDTSSLFKLYQEESGSEELEELIENGFVEEIFIADIARLEFYSAVFKRLRMKDLNRKEADLIIKLFESDYSKYQVVRLNDHVLNVSVEFISKYGTKGLRALDAIQLASAIEVKEIIDKYFTADQLLSSLFKSENLLDSLDK